MLAASANRHSPENVIFNKQWRIMATFVPLELQIPPLDYAHSRKRGWQDHHWSNDKTGVGTLATHSSNQRRSAASRLHYHNTTNAYQHCNHDVSPPFPLFRVSLSLWIYKPRPSSTSLLPLSFFLLFFSNTIRTKSFTLHPLFSFSRRSLTDTSVFRED